MYPFFLALHSGLRWLVVLFVLLAIGTHLNGWLKRRSYRPFDERMRTLATALVHLQFLGGMVLYFKSPITAFFRSNFREALQTLEIAFFGWYHILVMTLAVGVLSVGSSMGKRLTTDEGKFKTVAIYFFIAFLLFFLAIPWPFSPVVGRPYFRAF